MTRVKRGLVLEGGAMRGLFTAGVLDVWMENGITFDGIIGVSAGAAFGVNYKSGQIGRTVRYNKKYCRDKRFCGIRSLLRTGDIFGVRFCYDTLPHELDVYDVQAFRENPTEFYTVSTDVKTGKPHYHLCLDGDTETLDYIRASASMPFVSRPVSVEGLTLLDGGISDSIPLAYFESIGYNRNIVVLTQPKGFVKRRVRMRPLVRLALRRYPEAARAMCRRHEFYNETLRLIAEKEAKGEILVIRPDAPLPIGHISRDPERIDLVYRLGREVAERELDRLRTFLDKSE